MSGLTSAEAVLNQEGHQIRSAPKLSVMVEYQRMKSMGKSVPSMAEGSQMRQRYWVWEILRRLE